MSQVQSSGYCAICQETRMYVKPRINHVLHLILSVLTLGIWMLLVWLPLGIINAARAPRCVHCGAKQMEAVRKVERDARIAQQELERQQLQEPPSS